MPSVPSVVSVVLVPWGLLEVLVPWVPLAVLLCLSFWLGLQKKEFRGDIKKKKCLNLGLC